MQSRGEKRGKRKEEGELVIGGKSRSESESPESFFSCRLHYLMKTRKISHEETFVCSKEGSMLESAERG